MSNYIPQNQKKNRLFSKRERELAHAIRHTQPLEKLEALAEKLRAAKMGVFKDRFDQFEGRIMKEEDKKLVQKWMTMTNQEILAEYQYQAGSTS